MEQIIFSQIEMNRNRTLSVAAGLTEKQADIIPEGFNNNIRWHLGHILTTQERFSFRLIQEQLELPEELMDLFQNGTKPSDWQTAPPDLATLIKLLEEQPRRVQKRLQGKLGERIKVPFKDLKQLDEALIFSIGHEAAHTGYIMALKKAISQEAAAKSPLE